MDYKAIELYIWDDKKFRALSKEAKLFFIYLMSNKNCSKGIGLYEIPDYIIEAQFQTKKEKYLKLFKELAELQIVEHDPSTDLVWVVNGVNYYLSRGGGSRENKIKGITNQLKILHESTVLENFHNKYNDLGYQIPIRYLSHTHLTNTITNTNIKNNDTEKPKEDVVEKPVSRFDEFWQLYPSRNGRKIGKGETKELFDKLNTEDINDILKAVVNYKREVGNFAKDAIRFIKKDYWKDYLCDTITTETKVACKVCGSTDYTGFFGGKCNTCLDKQ